MTDPQRFDVLVDDALQRLDARHIVRAVVQRDGRALRGTAIAEQLGWIHNVARLREHVEQLTVLARVTERQGYDRALVLGDAGWSSVIGRHLVGSRGMKVREIVGDYSLPADLAWAAQGRALFVVLDGGAWSRTLSQYRTCRGRFDDGDNFVAVGATGSDAARLAAAEGFREVFVDDAQLRGAFGATGLAGLVPAVLAGVVITDALERIAERLEQSTEPEAHRNPAAQLAAFLWAAEQTGRVQVNLAFSKDVSALAGWISGLLYQIGSGAARPGATAGTTLLPIQTSATPAPLTDGQVQRGVVLGLSTFEHPDAPGLDDMEDRGMPGHSVVMPGPEDLWSEAIRWQMAVALLAVLRVTPDDSASDRGDDEASIPADLPADDPADLPADAAPRAISTLVGGTQPRAVPSVKAIAGALQAELRAGGDDDVLAVLAFMPPTEANGHRFAALRGRLQGRTAARVHIDTAPSDARRYTSLRGVAVVVRETPAAPTSELAGRRVARGETDADLAIAALGAEAIETRVIHVG